MQLASVCLAIIEWVGCEVTHFIVPNDGKSSSWTCEGMFCSESGSADTHSGQVSGCPVVAKTECICQQYSVMSHVAIYDIGLLILKVSPLLIMKGIKFYLVYGIIA